MLKITTFPLDKVDNTLANGDTRGWEPLYSMLGVSVSIWLMRVKLTKNHFQLIY